MLHIETFIVGELQTNCYCVSDSQSRVAFIIDPGDDASYIAQKIAGESLKPKAVLATHGHFDHVLSAFELQHIFTVPFYIHQNDEFLLQAMKKTAESILINERSYEADEYCMPIKEILTLIPGA